MNLIIAILWSILRSIFVITDFAFKNYQSNIENLLKFGQDTSISVAIALNILIDNNSKNWQIENDSILFFLYKNKQVEFLVSP